MQYPIGRWVPRLRAADAAAGTAALTLCPPQPHVLERLERQLHRQGRAVLFRVHEQLG